MLQKNLYVRVKRSREDDPMECLCIVEDSAPTKKRSIKNLEAQLSGLDATSAPAPGPKRLILSRVRTLDCANDELLYSDQANYVPSDEPPRKRRVTAAKIVVTSGSKTLNSETSQQCVVIDMAQLATKVDQKLPITNIGKAPDCFGDGGRLASVPTSRILDPATRTLDRGILTAIKVGDFNDVSAALMQGANADHQTAATIGAGKVGGYTALMAAAMHCNLRMVKRLITKGVDVGKLNGEGKSALDMIVVTPRNKGDATEIRSLLHNALVKAAQIQSKPTQQQHNTDAMFSNRITSKNTFTSSTREEDYVYDIYCVGGGRPSSTSSAEAKTNNQYSSASTATTATDPAAISARGSPNGEVVRMEGVVEESNSDDLLPYSVVRVEGLRILDSDHIELMMAYDSDWSDLGDDEDPDSNDERFHGNDYPDEEEDDDVNEGYAFVDSDQEEDNKQQQKRGNSSRMGLPKGVKVGSFLPGATDAKPTGAPTRRLRPDAPRSNNKVHFRTDGSTAAEVDLQDLIDQEEADDARGLYDEDGEREEEDDEEEERLYRELDGDYCVDAGSNSDYDMDADDAQEAEVCANLCNSSGRKKKANTSGAQKLGKSIKNNSKSLHEDGCVSLFSSAESLLCDDDDNLPDFERRLGIGKVLRPQILPDSLPSDDGYFAQVGLYQEPHTTESLQELWGEGAAAAGAAGGAAAGGGAEAMSGYSNSYSNSKSSGVSGLEREHADRLAHMRTRTGMVFASSLREFDSHTGLAKYGMELSDGEEDVYVDGGRSNADGGDISGGGEERKGYEVVPAHSVSGGKGLGAEHSLLRYQSYRPPPDTVAYDSELDRSD